MEKQRKILIGDSEFELLTDDEDSIVLERYLGSVTYHDLKIETLLIPKRPLWLNVTIRLIRSYQRKVAPKLGNRCVFDPSCSHYSELAFRNNGFVAGISLTIKRLWRCRPGNGGIDMP
jgi:putative membrane protein insertion efficiency factor